MSTQQVLPIQSIPDETLGIWQRITTHCAHDHHDACTGCDCGCHWLMPLIRGQAQQAVGPSGRVWTLAT